MPIISGGSGGGGSAVLFNSVLGAPAATIDTGAGGVAGGHGSLTIDIYCRSVSAVVTDQVNIIFNNDSGAHYNVVRLQNSNTVVTGASSLAGTTGWFVSVPAANDTASVFGAVRVVIPNYDGGVGFAAGTMISGSPDSTAANTVNAAFSCSYLSTTAISRVAISLSSAANFATGTRLLIYGSQ